jgi:hypothetical protein
MGASLKLAELLGSLSYALDITEGQPEGHCVRSCWIGMHIGRASGLDSQSLWELYYAILLKDLGCSSNAARISALYLVDDRQFKQDFKQLGSSLPDKLGFVLSHTGRHAGWSERLASITHILRNGKEIADELIQTRCYRGADIARQLRFNENVARGIQSLDEHWDGSGRPLGLIHSWWPVLPAWPVTKASGRCWNRPPSIRPCWRWNPPSIRWRWTKIIWMKSPRASARWWTRKAPSPPATASG